MSDKYFEEIEKDIVEQTSEQLRGLVTFVMTATDDEFQALLARRVAADYVRSAIRDRIRAEIAECREWVHEAAILYSERLRHVERRSSIKTGQSDELVTQ